MAFCSLASGFLTLAFWLLLLGIFWCLWLLACGLWLFGFLAFWLLASLDSLDFGCLFFLFFSFGFFCCFGFTTTVVVIIMITTTTTTTTSSSSSIIIIIIIIIVIIIIIIIIIIGLFGFCVLFFVASGSFFFSFLAFGFLTPLDLVAFRLVVFDPRRLLDLWLRSIWGLFRP